MPYTAGHVANFMLDRAEAEGRPISQMKLLKLVYIGYGWTLALTGERLFDEPIYAWAHGPVIRSLYDEFKHFKAEPITCKSIDVNLDTLELQEPRIPEADSDANLILQKVWDSYKKFSAIALRNKTHEPDTPWTEVYRPDQRGIVIPDDLIRPYFRQKIRQYLDDASRRAAAAPATNPKQRATNAA